MAQIVADQHGSGRSGFLLHFLNALGLAAEMRRWGGGGSEDALVLIGDESRYKISKKCVPSFSL